MTRRAAALLVLAVSVSPAFALKMAPLPGIALRAATAEVIVTGTVTDFEKEMVEVGQYPGSPQKVSYKIAIVKIDDALAGSKNETHIKIGFLPTDIGIRRGQPNFELKENAEGAFFLRKHHEGPFYIFDYASQPLDAKAETYKADLETVKKAAAAVADPDKALAVKDAKARYFAAAVIVAKYRTAPSGSTVRSELVPAEQSKLILQSILEAGWSANEKDLPSPYQTFMKLGMTAKDGWKPAPFNGTGDFNAHMKDEFKKWRDGDGAKFQVQKYVKAK